MNSLSIIGQSLLGTHKWVNKARKAVGQTKTMKKSTAKLSSKTGGKMYTIAAVLKLFSDLRHLLERTQRTPLPGNQFLSQCHLH